MVCSGWADEELKSWKELPVFVNEGMTKKCRDSQWAMNMPVHHFLPSWNDREGVTVFSSTPIIFLL